jgi:hypothetical protein
MTPDSLYEMKIESLNSFSFIDLNRATLQIAASNELRASRFLNLSLSLFFIFVYYTFLSLLKSLI